jgi:hypothetical protein
MIRTALLLIVLALSSLGCARGDWTTETLTLVDVTGTWEGPFRFDGNRYGFERTTRWVLLQNGSKVRGKVQGPDGAALASIEGLVNGEVFSWQVTGLFPANPQGTPPNQSYSGEARVTIDELSGRAAGRSCPCTFVLRRVGSDPRGKEPR